MEAFLIYSYVFQELNTSGDDVTLEQAIGAKFGYDM